MTANFYPRPPRGGRPGQRHCADHLQNFYPRPPRGGRPATALHRGKAAVFLSTPSARRATFWRFRNGLCDEISIHALREEGDPLQSPPCALLSNFYPRPPRGGRLLTQQEITQINDFYPRPPRGGRPGAGGACKGSGYFYPRPPRGGRLVRLIFLLGGV